MKQKERIKPHAWLMHVDRDKATQFTDLARELKMTRSALLREAIKDLLRAYGKIAA